jgi:hypothetical protein
MPTSNPRLDFEIRDATMILLYLLYLMMIRQVEFYIYIYFSNVVREDRIVQKEEKNGAKIKVFFNFA